MTDFKFTPEDFAFHGWYRVKAYADDMEGYIKFIKEMNEITADFANTKLKEWLEKTPLYIYEGYENFKPIYKRVFIEEIK